MLNFVQGCAPCTEVMSLWRGKVGLAEFANEQNQKDAEMTKWARQVEMLPEIEDLPRDIRILDDFARHVEKSHVWVVKTKDGREHRRPCTSCRVLGPQAMSTSEAVSRISGGQAVFRHTSPSEKSESVISAVQDLERFTNVSGFIDTCKLY